MAEQKNNLSGLGAVLVGSAVGMAAGAAAVALTNDKTRKKLKHELNRVLKNGEHKIEDWSEKTEEVSKTAVDMVNQKIAELEKKITEEIKPESLNQIKKQASPKEKKR